jgi:hypothetical protein
MMQSKRAYAALLAALGVEQLRLCEHVAFGDAHGVWRVLLATYERQSVATRVQLIERLLAMRLTRGEGVSLYVARLTDTVRKLAEQDESVGAATQLYVLLRGAQDVYPTVVALLRMREALTFDDAIDALKNEEERRKLAGDAGTPLNEAHYARERGGGGGGGERKKAKDTRRCYACGQTGHLKHACPSTECRRCLRRGHVAANCHATHPARKRGGGGRDDSSDEEEEAHVAEAHAAFGDDSDERWDA